MSETMISYGIVVLLVIWLAVKALIVTGTEGVGVTLPRPQKLVGLRDRPCLKKRTIEGVATTDCSHL
jgi:hypothetical protein